ncbi:glycoside hydrolase family 95 protein [Cohnella thailandensis]|uniref:Glycoside hydrolase family 95 protein n=1 Tax=Cohnella thailandensis TaxID=557557 RepID=A0A841SUE0_9BACL|nr:glycoside hydrolase family 95 protein [Cohnella thailandensis]
MPVKLGYDRPAASWKEGLPIGNGRIGAVIASGGSDETWFVTESTYWSGKPERMPSRSRGKPDLERMRKLFFEGRYEEGERLVGELLQPEKGNFGTNLPMADVILSFGHSAEEFARELSLDEAVARAAYRSAGVSFVRETFASHADGVLASRLRSGKPGSLSFTLRLRGRTDAFAVREQGDGTLVFEGQATETVHSDGTCGVRCRGIVRVVVSGGSGNAKAHDGAILVEGADEACVYLAVATDYRAADDDWTREAEAAAARAARDGFEAVRERHLDDYRRLFGRVRLDLGGRDRVSLPTDERIRRLRRGENNDPELFALFYQYARYLTIAGSREDSPLPLHLQGIWNDGEANRMAWSCDYHLDVNTEMNYYPTESANLAECQLPLLRFVERLSEAGREAARDFYGCEGWVAHVFTNAWGFSAPGWHYSWGLNVTGGLWLAAQLMDHYEFGGDDRFLRETAYPVLRSAAEFFLDYMTVHPERGWLVTGPSNSPENSFYPAGTPDRSRTMSMGPVMDTMLVRRLFAFCRDAASKLEGEDAFAERLAKALPLLPPPMIGRHGQLQEWLLDYAEAQPDHRHLSHLYGLFPGSDITPERSPQLAEAARTTLERRQRESNLEDVEFTLALFAAGRARLGDGDKAREHVAYLIGELCFDNLLTFSKPGIAGAEAYIFVADGNFGGAAAIAEMLLQSHAGELHLLPALPAGWPEGSFAGLRARGGAEVGAAWKDGRLVSATVKAGKLPLRSTVRYGERRLRLELEPGESAALEGEWGR